MCLVDNFMTDERAGKKIGETNFTYLVGNGIHLRERIYIKYYELGRDTFLKFAVWVQINPYTEEKKSYFILLVCILREGIYLGHWFQAWFC